MSRWMVVLFVDGVCLGVKNTNYRRIHVLTQTITEILLMMLMAEILHHLGCMKPYK